PSLELSNKHAQYALPVSEPNRVLFVGSMGIGRQSAGIGLWSTLVAGTLCFGQPGVDAPLYGLGSGLLGRLGEKPIDFRLFQSGCNGADMVSIQEVTFDVRARCKTRL